MGLLSRIFSRNKEPDCHHFDKEFKAHGEWEEVLNHNYVLDHYERTLYFKCNDCGKVLYRYQKMDNVGRLETYKHITQENMPY